ncbi:hypothetical protein ABE10_00060, partial [Bacillus toyonensis]|nr:hypothetical protein [Bacillus toyonensis]
CVRGIACSSSPPTPRDSGSSVIVWENRSREVPAYRGGDIARLHALPDTGVPPAVPEVGLGAGDPHTRGDREPEPSRQARHAHDGRHDLHPRDASRVRHRHLHRRQLSDGVRSAGPLAHDRLRRGRLRRRLHEAAQSAQPRAVRMAQGDRPDHRDRPVRNRRPHRP